MPELPEVETIRRQLTKKVKGKRIANVVVRWSKKLNCSGNVFTERVRGARVQKVERRAKIIRIYLSNGWQLFIHLKMTGRLLVVGKNVEPTKHTHVVFQLEGGKQLFWEDYRKFGYIKMYQDAEADEFLYSFKFGPEPLERSFTKKVFSSCLRRHPNSKIKPLLLKQTCIAGIGNIYSDEALFRAKIHPLTQVKKITDDELGKLYTASRKILSAAVKLGGSSSDSYVDVYGKQGKFVPRLRVYGREGEPCKRCRMPIKRIKIGGRSAHLCQLCQKKS